MEWSYESIFIVTNLFKAVDIRPVKTMCSHQRRRTSGGSRACSLFIRTHARTNTPEPRNMWRKPLLRFAVTLQQNARVRTRHYRLTCHIRCKSVNSAEISYKRVSAFFSLTPTYNVILPAHISSGVHLVSFCDIPAKSISTRISSRDLCTLTVIMSEFRSMDPLFCTRRLIIRII